MSILVLGTLALDSVKTPYGMRRNILGGSAAHFAMAARLFTEVNLVAIIGEDFPRRYIDFLSNKGIILSSLMVSPGKTFRWKGEYRGDLNNAVTLNTKLGVLSVFKPKILAAQRKIEYIFLANLDPDIQRHLLRHMRSPGLVGLDSMNYWIDHKKKSLMRLLKEVDIFLANENEARALAQEVSLLSAARRLREMGPEMIIIKKGEHGVLFYSSKFIFSLPAYPVHRLIDPTGAGDTFAGGFMGYLAEKKKISEKAIRKAIAYGVVCASFNVERFGLDRTAEMNRVQVNQRMNKLRSVINF